MFIILTLKCNRETGFNFVVLLELAAVHHINDIEIQMARPV